VSVSAAELLEFPRLREIVGRYTTCAPGHRAILALHVRSDVAELTAEFALIREAIAYLREGQNLGFGGLPDPEGWLAKLEGPSNVLSTAELLDAAALLDLSGGLRATLRGMNPKYPLLSGIDSSLADLRSLLGAIRKAIHPNGEVSDNASAELKRIRGATAKTRDKIHKLLEGVLRARAGANAEEGYVTQRNDRFVIPVRASERRSLQGIVHGASATGQTIFVEPLEAVEWNNNLVHLAEEETAEIFRILSELTGQLRDYRGPLLTIVDSIAKLDSIFARGRFAREFDCIAPEFIPEVAIRLKNARNPVLEDALRPQGRKVIPISLTLGDPNSAGPSSTASATVPSTRDTVLIISGPNTGGKTVTLKTVGLAVLAGQSGIPVAAEGAELPLLEAVLADIGDEQSITADLSTFSAHVLNIRRMLSAANDRTLILLDELGSSTSPEEGSALAVAVLEEIRQRGSLVIATTHLDRLKSYGAATAGVVNAAAGFDETDLRPTYQLLIGVPGMSSGIAIAQRLGLPSSIIDRANSELSPAQREAQKFLAYLHASRQEIDEVKQQAHAELQALEGERRSLRTEWVERQRKRIAELEKNFADTVKKLEAQVQTLTEEVKDRKARATLEKNTSRKLGKLEAGAREEANAAVLEHLSSSQPDLGVSAAAPRPPAPADLAAGTRVRVRGMNHAVVIDRIEGRFAEVTAGAMRMKVRVEDIISIDSTPTPAPRIGPASRGIEVHARSASGPEAEEINVIGNTVEQASELVDKFLDVAAVANLPRVRIIHGHGSGALRRGLRAFLANHPLVERAADEAEDRGGGAITVVDLRG
jgi:DNA mismatch repair protein MutS2